MAWSALARRGLISSLSVDKVIDQRVSECESGLLYWLGLQEVWQPSWKHQATMLALSDCAFQGMCHASQSRKVSHTHLPAPPLVVCCVRYSPAAPHSDVITDNQLVPLPTFLVLFQVIPVLVVMEMTENTAASITSLVNQEARTIRARVPRYVSPLDARS